VYFLWKSALRQSGGLLGFSQALWPARLGGSNIIFPAHTEASIFVPIVKAFLFLLSIVWFCVFCIPNTHGQSLRRPSTSLAQEPGTIPIETLLTKAVFLKIVQDTPIYVSSKLERAIGSMAPGTVVRLIAFSDQAYRVRGKARHGEVSAWIPTAAAVTPDPQLVPNLKKLHERQIKVEEMIAARQVALGMTGEEVQSSLGQPTRKSSKLNASGKEEKLEYVIYERVPQYQTSMDAFGRPFQTVTYLKMETGNLTVTLKDNVVESVEETKGHPLGSGGVKIVPAPMIFRF
jgi:hypothetical protein